MSREELIKSLADSALKLASRIEVEFQVTIKDCGLELQGSKKFEYLMIFGNTPPLAEGVMYFFIPSDRYGDLILNSGKLSSKNCDDVAEFIGQQVRTRVFSVGSIYPTQDEMKSTPSFEDIDGPRYRCFKFFLNIK